MKTLNFSLLFLSLSTLTLISCTPADQDLNRPAKGEYSGQNNSQDLRVGTYGQPIWTLQNIEQVGSLMEMCLRDESFPQVTQNQQVIKDCQLRYSDRGTISEKWTLHLVLNKVNQGLEVVSADGNLQIGSAMATMGKTKIYLTYAKKAFSFRQNSQHEISVDISSQGEMGSEIETLKFAQDISATGIRSAAGWTLKSLESQLDLPNKGQSFQVESTQVDLQWVTPQCAEPKGELQTSEVGKSSDVIAFSGTEAQLTSQPKRKWSRSLKSCHDKGARTQAQFNLEYLFY